MSQMDTRVVIRGGSVQWKVENFPQTYVRKVSDTFKIGMWNWRLCVKRGTPFCVSLFPACPHETPMPHARFFLCVTLDGKITSTVHEGLIRTCDDFAFPFGIVSPQPQLVIDVEFWKLKKMSNFGGSDISLWPSDGKIMPWSTPKCLSRMLNESILTDITINTADGGKTLRAHRAILSASSPVFQSMFLHELREKRSSIINIDDMAYESCMALLSYMYGTLDHESFWRHRLALLAAANKYDISELKDVCEESLVEDINFDNVFERLEKARLYQLNRLKKGCMKYLLDFGKKYDIMVNLNDFFSRGDKEFVVEILQEVLTSWYKA